MGGRKGWGEGERGSLTCTSFVVLHVGNSLLIQAIGSALWPWYLWLAQAAWEQVRPSPYANMNCMAWLANLNWISLIIKGLIKCSPLNIDQGNTIEHINDLVLAVPQPSQSHSPASKFKSVSSQLFLGNNSPSFCPISSPCLFISAGACHVLLRGLFLVGQVAVRLGHVMYQISRPFFA